MKSDRFVTCFDRTSIVALTVIDMCSHPPVLHGWPGRFTNMRNIEDPLPGNHVLTVWYDSGCPLCVREIAFMRWLDRREAIDFVDVLGDQPCPIDRAALLERFHAQERGGPVVSGAEAFAAMWRAIPWLWPLGAAARWKPVMSVLEFAYVRFLRVRPSLQRWVGGGAQG